MKNTQTQEQLKTKISKYDELKLIVITREDITPAYQTVQNCHSLADFIFEHPVQASEWKKQSNSIITLSVKTLNDLKNLSKKLIKKGYYVTEFLEPDIDNELTSICVYGTSEVRRQLSHLPLTLKKLQYE